jgi:acetoin utilization deacetylase AcuC-like enzyme
MQPLAIFYPPGHQSHAEYGHPERPERVEVIRRALEEANHWASALQVQALPVPEQIMARVHSSAYLSLLERTSLRGGHLDADTYVTPASWKLALQAAGGAISLARAVWDRQVNAGFALTRPPGHHATRGQGMGFCLLNNVALAAESLIEEGAKRIAIVDLDLHHGNGTQDIFWQRSEVLVISTHQQPLFPGTGSLEEQGQDEGHLATVNFPMPPGSGDLAFLSVMDQAILPLLHRYEPEMVLISYGFDAHWSDPLGSLLLSADGYARLISKLSDFAQNFCFGRVAMFLEGGYDLNAAAACSLAVVNALCGLDWQDALGSSPFRETDRWREMLARAKEIWRL